LLAHLLVKCLWLLVVQAVVVVEQVEMVVLVVVAQVVTVQAQRNQSLLVKHIRLQ
jgi:hypothetical protein